ncbi:hypothetical protein Agub_g14300, partial [Astrephomene gubernaculifera]
YFKVYRHSTKCVSVVGSLRKKALGTCSMAQEDGTRQVKQPTWLLALLLLISAIGPAQGDATDEPVVLTEAPGFHRATTDAEMAPIYRDNLVADFAPWMGRKYTVRQLYDLIDTLLKGRPQKYLSLVVLRHGKVAFLPLAARPMTLTLSRMRAIVGGLRNATAAGLSLPDSLFLMNVWDEGRCSLGQLGRETGARGSSSSRASRSMLSSSVGSGSGSSGSNFDNEVEGSTPNMNVSGSSTGLGSSSSRSLSSTSESTSSSSSSSKKGGPGCPVPLFSLIKSWDYSKNTSKEADVLLPFFNHVYGNLVNYPWEKKYDKALMRAALQAQMRPNSTRLWILQLQRSHPQGQRLLDAGITNNLSKRMKVKLANFVTIPDHARYKYLISADGFTASCRLGKLMGTNSVVLKESTPWVEYYYRSLQPGVHFVPFTKDDVLQVLTSLESDPARCHRVSAAAQQFAFTFLGQYSKALYVRQAVQMYNSLFEGGGKGGLEAFVEGLGELGEVDVGGEGGAGEAGGQQRQLTVVELMTRMKAFLEKEERRTM